jgi:hypothetical protein
MRRKNSGEQLPRFESAVPRPRLSFVRSTCIRPLPPAGAIRGPSICIFVAIVVALIVTLAPGARAIDSAVAQEGLPANVRADWWSAVQRNITQSEYQISCERGPTAAEAATGYQAPNRAQNFRTFFGADGIRVIPRAAHRDEAPAWEWRLALAGWGREGALEEPAGPPQMTTNGNRIEYRWEDLTEWYVNDARGLEQGFTIERRPEAGGAPSGSAARGPLRVELTVGGSLKATLADEGEAVNFMTPVGARAIRFDHLHVVDARQHVLPARFERLEDEEGRGQVAIVVDDAEAVYPITIDPLATSPAWTAESNQADAEMGFSVSTAGNVNGDGFSDVIVGANRFDNGQVDEGRAYVYHGSAAGLGFNASWIAEGDQAGANLGFSVAAAGDVNGDGFGDVVVGAYQFSNGETGEGRALVYHGSAGGLSLIRNWTAESDQVFAQFGYAVATAGDVNGDGFSDVIVGALAFSNGQAQEGRAFVYHGSAGGLSSVANWTAENNVADAWFGASVASAGDVNGDGYDDVIVGAPQYVELLPRQGQAIVYHGSASGLGGFNWVTTGVQMEQRYGQSVSTAGDVNGDGFSDVIVGAHQFDNGETDEGWACVYHGSPSGLAESAAWTAEGNQIGAQFGLSVATAGDVNGDGFSDVIVGARRFDYGLGNEGRAFLYQGGSPGLSINPNWTAEGDQAQANFGQSVATAGDVNGDGYSDVIVGAWQFDGGESNEGRALVYQGGAAGLGPNPNWSDESNQYNTYYGTSVATAGDVNGDGFSDVIVGAPYFDNGEADEGRAFVYQGSAAGLSFTTSWADGSNQLGGEFGTSVATAGDVNGDGFSDVVVGAPHYDNGQTDEGRAFVYHGSAGGLSPTANWTGESDEAVATFGFSVSTAGDVNGDGFSDLVVGAPLYGGTDAGRIFVYHGSSTGLQNVAAYTRNGASGSELGYSVGAAGDMNGDGFSDVIVGAPRHISSGRAFIFKGYYGGLGFYNPPLTLSGSTVALGFGSSVGTAGDVNADGFSDVIVGDPDFDNGPTSSHDDGKVYVFHGADVPSISPAWVLLGTQVGARLGTSVGTAGDVNGDGYSDVIVGAPFYNNGQTDEGAAFVYHGSTTGLNSPEWTAEGNQDFSSYGASVATAGDVNGDGYSDVIVGAPLFNNGQEDEGRVFVYYGNGGASFPFAPRQARTDDSAPISLLGTSDSETAFRLKASGHTAAGQGELHLQFEVKPAGVPFDGTGLITSKATGPRTLGGDVELSALASGLTPETLYHWRLRILSDSPFFPSSRWLSPPGNSPSEADVRTAGTASAVDDGTGAFFPVRLAAGSPNPFRSSTSISFTLPEPGRYRLAVYDIEGREVAVLASGVGQAGNQRLRWDGRDGAGDAMPSGLYFLRLEYAGQVESRKLMIVR